MKSLVLVLLLASILVSGCMILGEEENVTENVTPPPPPPPPPPTPSFSITSPLEGELVMIPDEGGDVTLLMTTQNLILRSPGGTRKVGEGHFQITVNGTSEVSSSKIFVMSNVEPGNYSVEVELLHNDGTSYVPSITDSVSFTVEKMAPEVYEPVTHTVSIKDFEYDPSSLTIKAGDSVTFSNDGAFPRSATSFQDGKEVFDSEVLGPGKSATVTIYQIGTFEFYSTTHRAMTGTLTVESNESG